MRMSVVENNSSQNIYFNSEYDKPLLATLTLYS
jgi:hypothetical protein